MIDDCSLGSIRSLIFISLLRKVPAGRWATPIPYGLRRRATASEMLAMYGIACHMLGLAIVLPAGRCQGLLLEGFHAVELGIIWKDYHGCPFEIHQCPRTLSNVDFLELHVYHLEFEEESAAVIKAQCPPNSPLPSRVYLGSRLTLDTTRK